MLMEPSNSDSVLVGVTSRVRNESTLKMLTKIKKTSKARELLAHTTHTKLMLGW